MRKKLTWLLWIAVLTALIPMVVVAVLLTQEVTCAEEYTVQADDWLSKIADKYLGNIMAYPAIVTATNRKHAMDDAFAEISNPDVIEIGWKVCVPNAADAQALLESGATAKPIAKAQKLILATTTSTNDSGLLDFILPDFEKTYNAEVDVVAVGTGQALEIGRKGDADVLLVHARAREDAFMDNGHGARREDVMYNDFVILGPAHDPAGIKKMKKVAEAFAKLAEAGAPFVSRGDDSGTHTKEKAIWAAAGMEPVGDWYISAGQGMGAVLTMANEQQAYTLSDRATYLARTLEGIDLEIMVEGDPIMFNPYGIIAINPDKGEHVKAELSNAFIDWFISVPTQEQIGEFGKAEFGNPLFTPDSAVYKAAQMGGATPPAD